MASQFNDKVVIVTGSSAGLGEAIALLFAFRGARVTLCGRDHARLKSVLDKAVKVSGGHQDRFFTVPGDLNDAHIRTEIIEQSVQKFGRLDILVTNAGIVGDFSSFLTENGENYSKILDTNLKTVFFVIQQVVPSLEKTKGHIINISPLASLMVVPSITTYSLSKLALDHLTRCLAVYLGSKGIRVNSVNPVYFPTLILRHLDDPEAIYREIAPAERAQVLLKDRLGDVEDVAEAVAFLASDAAGFIIGQLLKVDGGRNYSSPFKYSRENEED